MLTRILLFVLFLFNTFSVISQDGSSHKSDTGNVWSTSYFAGPFFSFEDEIGYEVSLETSLQDENKEYVFDVTFGKIPRSRYSYTNIIEVSVGPRFFWGKNRTFFAEAEIGGSVETKTRKYIDYFYYEEYSSSKSIPGFYLSAGIGGRMLLGEVNFLLYRLRFQTHLPYKEGTTHITGQFGIQFSDRESINNREQKEHKLSFSLLGGINNPVTGNKFTSKGEYTAGIECTFRSSPKIEWSIAAFYNKFQKQLGDPGILALNISPRFYMSRNSLTSFFESGAGIYFQTGTLETEYDRIQPGIFGGAGILGSFTDHFSLFVKGKFNFVFTKNPDFPFYTNLLGGVRYNL